MHRKESDPRIKNYIKEKKRKNKEKNNDLLIENIKNETKRMATLKLLDVNNQEGIKKISKKIKKNKKNKNFKTKKIEKNEKNEKKKFYLKEGEFYEPGKFKENNEEEKGSSDFIFEPDSALKQGLSGFTEETEQLNELNKEEFNIIQDNSVEEDIIRGETLQCAEYIKTSAAILIQYHVRRYLSKQKLLKIQESYSQEDNEVKHILTSWQQNISEIKPQEINSYNNLIHDQIIWQENQLLNLEELKRKEINEVIEVTKQLSQDSKLIDSLTKIIDERYNHITNILTGSIENESINNHITEQASNITEEDREDSIEKNNEKRVLDFSFPSYKSEKSLQEISFNNKNNFEIINIETQCSPGEIVIFEDYKIQNSPTRTQTTSKSPVSLIEEIKELSISEIKENEKMPSAPRLSPTIPMNNARLPEIFQPKSSIQITSAMVCELSETILSKYLEEEFYPYKINQRQTGIDKDSVKIQEYVSEIISLAEKKKKEIS